MSSPADIEVAGDTSWMTDETPVAVATPVQQQANNDDVIRAPSHATTGPSPVIRNVNTGGNNNNNNNNNNNSATTNVNTGGNNAGSAARAASEKTWRQYFAETFQRDGRLLLVTLGILVCMNIPYAKKAMYPFTLYSTWIHELCHGMAAIMAGGRIAKLEIFPDTSGLAYTSIPNNNYRGFVSSAGYQGTAFAGFLLLIFRRTKRGPRTGTMVVACAMLLSSILWIRNAFGFSFVFCTGLVLAVLAWFFPSNYIRIVYVILAVTCSLNAITSVHDLFGANQVVNGQPASTDAHTMADITGGSYMIWAVFWFFLAVFLTLMGILFAIPGPDEVADFSCCGVCQDFGLFTPCNYPGMRCLRRFRRNNDESNADNNGEANNPAGP